MRRRLANAVRKERPTTMARVLLINPGMDVAAAFGEYRSLMEPMPCVGVAYLAAAARQYGHEVRVLDNFVENLPTAEIARLTREWDAQVIGLSMLTPSAHSTTELGRALRRQTGAKVVYGNLHAALFADEVLNDDAGDAVVHGEGEHSFPLLAEALADDRLPTEIPGLSLFDGKNVIHTGPPQVIEDLDALPWPAWDMLPHRSYTFLPFVTVAKPCLSLLSSRGCPFSCRFCALGYQGNRVRTRSAENIAAEIDWLVRDYGIRHVGFVDPIFPLNKKIGLAVCEAIRARNIPHQWWWTSETRVDVIDEEICRAMRAARCKRILFGVESGVNELLTGVGKNFTTDDARRAVRVARAAGLEISAFFMLGLPGETAEMTRRTIEFARELDIDFAKFGLTVPLPGSALYDEMVEQGRIERHEWDKFTTFNPDPDSLAYIPEGMTGAQLQRLHRRATWRFYARPKMFFRQLFVTRSIGLKQMFNGARILLKQWWTKRL